MPRLARLSFAGLLSLAASFAPGVAQALVAAPSHPAAAPAAIIAVGDIRHYGAPRRANRAHTRRIVTRENGVIAVGRPTERYLRPVPSARPSDIEARRAARERTPAFTSRRVADGRRYGAQRPGNGERGWRPSQHDMRNVGALAGAAYGGEIVAQDALDGAYDTQPATPDVGSMAVDNRPRAPGGVSYSVSSEEAGGFTSYSNQRPAVPFDDAAPPPPGVLPLPPLPNDR